MDFHQHFQTQRFGGFGQTAQLIRFQALGNQEDHVSTHGLGFKYLVVVHHKILAQHWNLIGLAPRNQVGSAAAKKLLIGQDGQARGTGIGVAFGHRSRICTGIDVTFGGGPAFEFRNDARAFRMQQ